MRKILVLISFFLFAHVSADTDSEKFKVIFGSIDDSSGYDDVKKEANIFELKTLANGYKFGFKVIPKNDDSYTYYTVSYLPSMPKTVGGLFDENAKSEYASGLKSPALKDRGPIIIPFWFEEGDPLGVYRTEIYINGVPVKIVQYTVVAPRK